MSRKKGKSLSSLYRMKEEADYRPSEAESELFWIEEEIRATVKKRKRRRN